jgi:polysaccharide biosynthesis/export protein
MHLTTHRILSIGLFSFSGLAVIVGTGIMPDIAIAQTLYPPTSPTPLPVPVAPIPAATSLGPMPLISPPVAAGDPEKWETPDRANPPLVRPATYTLAIGDRINVAMASVPEFSAVYQVMVDGRITLPVIGAVDVQGMTEPEAAQHIAQRYTAAQVLVKPTITVVLAEMSNLHVAVLGEVNRPGAYTITPQNGELPTLTEVIEKAGGITHQTDLQRIQIRRQQRPGKERVIQTSLWQLLTTGDLSQDLAIRDGDAISLQAAPNIPTDVALTVGRSNVGQAEIQVNLLGEVASPGLKAVPIGTSLNQAILMAGGLTGQAKKKSIELLRLNPNGTVSQQKIAINYNQSIDAQLNPMLQNRDVILVDRSMSAKLTDKIGNILTPINSILSLFNVFSPFFPKSR